MSIRAQLDEHEDAATRRDAADRAFANVDSLECATWQACSSAPGAFDHPGDLGEGLEWIAANVPGTAAGALRDAGLWLAGVKHDFDDEDWWYRCQFDRPDDPAPYRLSFNGLATIADVWLNGAAILHSDSMFAQHDVLLERLEAKNELAIRFSALSPHLVGRQPRPRWKTGLVRAQALRGWRTALVGRIPVWGGTAAPVGPWRPVRLHSVSPALPKSIRLITRCVGEGGVLEARVELGGNADPEHVYLSVNGVRAPLTQVSSCDSLLFEGTVHLVGVERWWPHTHGTQTRYPVTLELDGVPHDLGSVAFRSIEVQQNDGNFEVIVNGVEIFCRGMCWIPPDVISLAAPVIDVADSLRAIRGANMNLVRITGNFVYEDETFLDLCDELGMLVWQDCMFSTLDLPDDPEFIAAVRSELESVFSSLSRHPCIAVVCGSSEGEQQPAMLGLSAEQRSSYLLQTVVPEILASILPEMTYVSSSPSGGPLPFHPGSGVAHYFGVGAYLRPLADARFANVRFASECLAFSIPPDRAMVETSFPGNVHPIQSPEWAAGTPCDAGAAWNFQDVTNFYVDSLFDRGSAAIRYSDPDYFLDLQRAAVSTVMETVFTEWRRPESSCAGGVLVASRDLLPGPGFGIFDAHRHRKAPWYALRRALAPVAALLTDEGLNGLSVHLINEGDQEIPATLLVRIYALDGRILEDAKEALTLAPRSSRTMSVDGLFDGFRDLTYAYRFGPAPHDAVGVTLMDEEGEMLGQSVYLPHGLGRAKVEDVGLDALVEPIEDGLFRLAVTSKRLAEFVEIDADGFLPDDSWFHLLPGATRHIILRPDGATGLPTGEVRALNARTSTRITLRANREVNAYDV